MIGKMWATFEENGVGKMGAEKVETKLREIETKGGQIGGQIKG